MAFLGGGGGAVVVGWGVGPGGCGFGDVFSVAVVGLWAGGLAVDVDCC